jgi:hypothetical protein
MAGFEPENVSAPFVALAVIVKAAAVTNLLASGAKVIVFGALDIVIVRETDVAVA